MVYLFLAFKTSLKIAEMNFLSVVILYLSLNLKTLNSLEWWQTNVICMKYF